MKKVISLSAIGLCVLLAHPAHATDATSFIRSYADKFGVPVPFAMAIAKVESNHKCGLVGKRGERGPLQIHPQTAAGLGYKNITNSSCERQTEAGMAHLSHCWKQSSGDKRLAAACHNQGFGVLKTGRISRGAAKYAQLVLR